jgi:hypothetical protein
MTKAANAFLLLLKAAATGVHASVEVEPAGASQ